MYSYDKIRKRQYSLVEQEAKPAAGKGRDAQTLARKYNRIIGGTAQLDDATSKQYKAELLAKLDKPPEQIAGTGGRFDPVFVPSKKAGSFPKIQFQNGARSAATISLSVGGSDASINGMSLAGAVEYLRGQVAEDPEGQANADASQEPALEPDVQTQDDGTVFDANTGQEIDQVADYIPYEATPEELSSAGEKMDGILPGVTAQGLYDKLTLPPNNANTRLMAFKRSLRDGESPWLPPEVQKDIFKAHVDVLGIAKNIKEGKYIDDKDLTPRERRLLDAFVCRNPTKNAGAWFGRQKAMPAVREVAPNFASYLETTNSSPAFQGMETYGMTMGAYTNKLCEQFKGIEIREKNGETRPAMFDSTVGGGAGKIFQNLGTKKESLMIGMLNTFFGTETVDTSVASMEDFAGAIEAVCELGDIINDFVPVEGNLAVTMQNEDARVATESILEQIDTENCHEAAVNYIKDTIKESYLVARVAKEAGVTPSAVISKAKSSTASEKADLVIEFATPEDAQKFAARLSELGAGEVTIAPTESGALGISLKSQSSFSKDTPSGGAYYHSAYAYHDQDCDSQSTQATKEKCRQASEFSKFQETKLTPKERGLSKKAAEADLIISRGAEALFGSDARARSSIRHTFSVLLGEVGADDVKTLRMISDWEEEIGSAIKSGNADKIGNARINFIRRLRELKADQSPELMKGFAINDLCSSFLTVEDDAMMKAMRGEIRFAGNHQVANYVLKNATPQRTPGGGYSWVIDGKVVFSTDLRAKSSQSGGTRYPKMEAKVRAVLFDLLGTAIKESKQLGEKEIYGKLNELLEAIHVAVAK